MWRMLCLFAGVCALLFVREASLQPDGKLHMHVFDVGQGDAIFLVTPHGHQVLIDGGPDLSVLTHLGNVMPFFDRSIDLVVLTHSDADHITALPQVLQRYDVENILLSGELGSTGRVDALLAAIGKTDTEVLLANPKEDFVLSDGVVLDVLWPTPQAHAGKFTRNDLSIVMQLRWKEHSILLAGDIEAKAERAISNMQKNIRSKVLKIAHHGSKSSTTEEFLRAVDPEVAIISAGRENPFGHPHKEVLNRLRAQGITTKTTASEHVVSLEFR